MRIYDIERQSGTSWKTTKLAKDKGLRTCSLCGEEKQWKFLKWSGMKRIYVDEGGGRWSASHCYSCYMKRHHPKKITGPEPLSSEKEK